MGPAATTATPTKPHSGLTPTRKARRAAGGAHVAEGVAGEGLAPHHGEHPTTPAPAPPPPRHQGGVHRRVGEEAGLEERVEDRAHRGATRARSTAAAPAGSSSVPRTALGAGHHHDPAVDPEHVDRVAVELAQHLGADDLVGGPAGGPARGHVDDPVHHRQQRVHVVGREQHGDLLLAGRSGPAARPPRCSLAMSRLASGSSRSSSRGRLIRAWAISTRCCSPPERLPTRASAKRVASTASSISSTVWRRRRPTAAAARSGARRAPGRPRPGPAAACRGR